MLTQRPSCVVLGGGGFIGTNLCRRLVQSGHRVRAFGRRGLFQAELEGVEWYPGEFTDAGSVAAAVASFLHGAFPALVADTFGVKYAAANAGTMYTAKGTAALLVPLGSILSAGGNWDRVFIFTAAITITAGILSKLVLQDRVQAAIFALRHQ